MYNRYIRNDQGRYTRVQEEERAAAPAPEPPKGDTRAAGNAPPPPPPPPGENRERSSPERDPTPRSSPSSGGDAGFIRGTLRHILDQLHLEQVDTGDLLLLLILFFLMEEGADEEILIALGLMLIL